MLMYTNASLIVPRGTPRKDLQKNFLPGGFGGRPRSAEKNESYSRRCTSYDYQLSLIHP